MALSETIKNNYLTLSKEQRQEFMEINQEILKGKADNEELKALWDKLSSIIRIDYKTRTEKITDLAAIAFRNQSVSTRELLIAIEKRKINNGFTITRLKTRSETGGSYQDCLNDCQKAYLSNLNACYDKYGRGDDSPERNRCVMNAGANLNVCNAGCIKYQ